VADIAADAVRRIGIRLAALAQDGLTFATGDYDLDRYRQVSQLAAELLAVISGRPAADLAVELGRDSGYATPKVDVRGAIFDDRERVLLMQEKTDRRWSLPGGWADPGDAPSAAATREILEETGYHSSAVKLIAWAGSTTASSSGPWPTTGIPRCPPSSTRCGAARRRHARRPRAAHAQGIVLRYGPRSTPRSCACCGWPTSSTPDHEALSGWRQASRKVCLILGLRKSLRHRAPFILILPRWF
jgi:8-oxo-dGTP pyrophosphatase MutT (NUDIX family)